MKSLLPTTAVILGIVLLAASAAWAILFPASRAWTEEKSTRMTQLGNQATEIARQLQQAKTRPSMHSGENPAELQAKYDVIAAEYKALHEEFTSAQDGPKSAATFLKWSGIAFVVAGGLIVFATRSG